MRPWLDMMTADLPYLDPFAASLAFGDCAVSALLDSGGVPEGAARFSYLCVDPFHVVEARGNAVWVDGRAVMGRPLDVLAEMLARYRMPPDPAGFALRGGAVGYIGYELGAGLEHVATAAAAVDDPPDMVMGFYDLVIGFDRQTRLCRVHSSFGQARLDWACERLAAARGAVKPLAALAFQPDWTAAEHAGRIRRVLEYIGAGDIFQANITMRATAARPAALAASDLHAALRQRNPAPFAAWLRCGAHDVCCSSPERFLRLAAGGAIETRPIKGTSARHADPVRDADAAVALAGSAKDRAENVMIVDVLRNDLGRVARRGSVAVPSLCVLESFATVHHLVSRVTAVLRPELGAIDVLRAALPGGSITGAPKIRAMQIIAELEGQRRGIYCGTIAWIGFDGAMDSNIVIRSLVLTPRRVIMQAGGGIVADSDPAAEYAEMQLKLAPMRDIFAG